MNSELEQLKRITKLNILDMIKLELRKTRDDLTRNSCINLNVENYQNVNFDTATDLEISIRKDKVKKLYKK